MEGYEVEEILNSMVILVDTREQPSARADKRYRGFSAPYRRQKLDFGDYSAVYRINEEERLLNVAIERKMNLEELSGCFTQSRDRFEREFERAKKSGAKMYLIVENTNWENLINGKYNTKYNPVSFFSSIFAWVARYNIIPIFCKAETSGRIINQILYRELKEVIKNE